MQTKYSAKETDPNGHGSCVFSKVNSASFGTAKKSNMMIVKISDQVTTFEVLDGLNSILTHVKQNSLQKKAVINLSLGLPESSFNAVTAVLLKQVLAALDAQGVVIVCAAGNYKVCFVLFLLSLVFCFQSLNELILVVEHIFLS